MHYDIIGLCPSLEHQRGGHGFSIELHPGYQRLVQLSHITQQEINTFCDLHHRQWLDGCGYDTREDPETANHPFLTWDRPHYIDRHHPRAKEARPIYDRTSIRIEWGAWGPEHLCVPGSAAGLDIERYFPGIPRGNAALLPHNLDGWPQVQLLLVMFTSITNTMVSITHDGTKEADPR